MPNNPDTINLISTKTGLSPQLSLIETSLRRTSGIAIVAFLLIGLSVGGLFMYYSSQLATLESTRTTLRNEIAAAKHIEGLLTSIKDRTRIVEKTMDSQRPWAKTLNLLGEIAVPPALAGVSVDENSKIETTIQANSIDDLVSPVRMFISMAREGRIRNPVLQSVQVGKNGFVTISVSFIMVF